jgi:predicted dehydrogenase
MPVTVGLVGAGARAAEVFAPALADSPEVRLTGVWARRREAAEDLARRHDAQAFDSHGDLVEHCQAVVYAVPPATQADLAPYAARRGRGVLLGVPTAADRAGAEQVVLAVQEGRAVSMLVLPWRFAADVRLFLDDQVPALSPRGASAQVVVGRPATGQAGGVWRHERPVVWGMGPHLLDLLEAALGPIPDVRAHGDPKGWISIHGEHQVGRFSNSTIHLTEVGQPSRAVVEVFGVEGSAQVDAASAVGPPAYRTLVDEFGGAVAARRAGDLDAERGLHLFALVEAVDDDLLRGR